MRKFHVPVHEGSLIVFSTVQLAAQHRIEINRQRKHLPCTLDLLGFLVVDQRHPLQSPANRPGFFKAPLPSRPFEIDEDDSDEESPPRDPSFELAPVETKSERQRRFEARDLRQQSSNDTLRGHQSCHDL